MLNLSKCTLRLEEQDNGPRVGTVGRYEASKNYSNRKLRSARIDRGSQCYKTQPRHGQKKLDSAKPDQAVFRKHRSLRTSFYIYVHGIISLL